MNPGSGNEQHHQFVTGHGRWQRFWRLVLLRACLECGQPIDDFLHVSRRELNRLLCTCHEPPIVLSQHVWICKHGKGIVCK